jgi:hypothetical protein
MFSRNDLHGPFPSCLATRKSISSLDPFSRTPYAARTTLFTPPGDVFHFYNDPIEKQVGEVVAPPMAGSKNFFTSSSSLLVNVET